MEFAPDALGSAFTMMSLPQGTPIQDRLLVGAEDLALGVGGSFGGRFAGGMAGALAGGKPMQVRGAMRSGAGIGGMAGGMGAAMFGPRPFYGGIQARLEEQARLEQEQQMQGIFQQGIMAGAQDFAQEPRVIGIDNLLSTLYG